MTIRLEPQKKQENSSSLAEFVPFSVVPEVTPKSSATRWRDGVKDYNRRDINHRPLVASDGFTDGHGGNN